MGTDSFAGIGVEIRSSGIHRRGVYALRAFRAGEVVLAWNTSHRVPRDGSVISGDTDVYFHPYDSDTLFVVQSPECFVNHSCDNNTVVLNFADVAIRDIQPGEEISSNYETDGAGLTFICNCGAGNCRGVIGRGAGDTSPPHA